MMRFIINISFLWCFTNAPIYAQRLIAFSKTEHTAKATELTSPICTIEKNSTDAIRLKCHFENAEITEQIVNSVVYSDIKMKGLSQDFSEGRPCVPGTTLFIPLNTKNPRLVLKKAEGSTYDHINILPAQIKTYGTEEETHVVDKTIYERDAFYPKEPVTIQDVQLYRGKPFAFVRINPIQYNPVTNTIKCIENLDFEIQGADPQELAPRLVSTDHSISTKQEKFIIVTRNDFLSQIEEFVSWKKEQGYKVDVISKVAWNNDIEVRDSIRSHYLNDDATCETKYVMIIGNYAAVPAKIYLDGQNSYLSDHFYSCMDGADDYYPDIARGRIPFYNSSEAANFLDFLINKEKGITFYGRGSHCAFFNCLPDKITEALNCVCFSEELKDYMESHTFQIQRIYTTGNTTDPQKYSRMYASNGDVPPELRRPTFAWNGSLNDIVGALQNGCDYILYKGHGNCYGLAQIGMSTSSLNNITGNICSPIFACLSCSSGDYQGVSSTGTVSSLGASFIVNLLNRQLSVGALCSCGECSCPYVEPFAGGFFSSLFQGSVFYPTMTGLPNGTYNPAYDSNTKEIYELGNMMNFGFSKLISSRGVDNNVRTELTHMHIMGDPSYQFPVNSPVDLTNVQVYQVNDNIYINTNGVENCDITFILENENGESISYKKISNLTGTYSFTPDEDYSRIIVQKPNCHQITYHGISDVYLQNRNITNNKYYHGKNIQIGYNVSPDIDNGDVTVSNNAMLRLGENAKVKIKNNFKCNIGSSLQINKNE